MDRQLCSLCTIEWVFINFVISPWRGPMDPRLELALGWQAKLNEYEFPVKKVANVQSQLSRLIEKNYYLNKSAREVRGSVVARFVVGAIRYRTR